MNRGTKLKLQFLKEDEAKNKKAEEFKKQLEEVLVFHHSSHLDQLLAEAVKRGSKNMK